MKAYYLTILLKLMKKSLLKILTSAIAGIALTLSVDPMPANAIVFNLQGTFTDGGTFSGSFDYNNQAQNITNWNITTTQGSQLPGTTYTSSNPNAFVRVIQNEPGSIPINVLFFFANNLTDFFTAPVGTLYEQDFQIEFPDQTLTNFVGGSIPSDLGIEAWFTRTPEGGVGIQRTFVSGSATPVTSVPEPSEPLALVAATFCGFLGLRTKHKMVSR